MSKDSQLWLKWFTESNTYPLDKECFKSWVSFEKIQWLKHYSTGKKEDRYQWWPTGLTKISKMRFCWMGEDQLSLMTEMIHWLKDWMWKEWYLIIIKNDSLTGTLICWTGDDYVLIMIEMITDSNTDLPNKNGWPKWFTDSITDLLAKRELTKRIDRIDGQVHCQEIITKTSIHWRREDQISLSTETIHWLK